MRLSVYLWVLFIAILFGCDSLDKGSKAGNDKKDGVVKQYRPDGSIKTEITFKDGVKNGPAKSYYKNGKLRQEINYVNNVKDGPVVTYYENGKKYQVTPYANGQIEGKRLKYRMDGKLMAEVPYHNGNPCAGLKEYLTDGSPKTKYPEIVVKEINNLLKSNEYILRVSISDHSKHVVYYLGEMDEGGCIRDDAMRIEPQKPGILELKYNVQPGMFTMETLNIIAVVETRLGNPYITQRKYNLAIENRG